MLPPGYTIHWHEQLPSTNTFLKDWARRNPTLPEGTVVAARQQDAGRGRRGRAWQSAAGRDLAFSLLLRPDAPPAQLPSLPLLAALVVAEALEHYALDARVKWPNDVRIDGEKIAGILVESVPGDSQAFVVGIGVNTNSTRAELSGVGQPATSIRARSGGTHSLDILLARILDAFAGRYPCWLRDGFGGIRAAWLARAEILGQSVTVRDGGQLLDGIAEAYGGTGALLLRDAQGVLHTVYAGDLEMP